MGLSYDRERKVEMIDGRKKWRVMEEVYAGLEKEELKRMKGGKREGDCLAGRRK